MTVRTGHLAEVGSQESWCQVYRYPDGWIDIPLSGASPRLRARRGRVGLVLLGAFVGFVAIAAILRATDLPNSITSVVTWVLLLAWLVCALIWGVRNLFPIGGVLTLGVPVIEPFGASSPPQSPTSAVEHHRMQPQARLTLDADVASVTAARHRRQHRVEVHLRDGSTRTYQTPYAASAALLAASGG